ncbi:hypothetical protein B0H17DRAFT_1221162 [Mycena rosella]|uniref:Uncharacterized protein n=1 Tax=Mycena rosella TaxID=1033263 RepID=A0AAD7FA01_MYCRO|nr:hypothetical protein B0H17DRAFT_1221162 [Mycena rosella]
MLRDAGGYRATSRRRSASSGRESRSTGRIQTRYSGGQAPPSCCAPRYRRHVTQTQYPPSAPTANDSERHPAHLTTPSPIAPRTSTAYPPRKTRFLSAARSAQRSARPRLYQHAHMRSRPKLDVLSCSSHADTRRTSSIAQTDNDRARPPWLGTLPGSSCTIDSIVPAYVRVRIIPARRRCPPDMLVGLPARTDAFPSQLSAGHGLPPGETPDATAAARAHITRTAAPAHITRTVSPALHARTDPDTTPLVRRAPCELQLRVPAPATAGVPALTSLPVSGSACIRMRATPRATPRSRTAPTLIPGCNVSQSPHD